MRAFVQFEINQSKRNKYRFGEGYKSPSGNKQHNSILILSIHQTDRQSFRLTNSLTDLILIEEKLIESDK